MNELVQAHPVLAVAIAATAGAAAGGLLLSQWGRLAFVAAVGYVGNDLWHREGRLDIDDIIEKLSKPSKSR